MRKGKKTVLVINGPNLNLLGLREPQIYGHETLKDVENNSINLGQQLNAEVDFFQTNWEGACIDRIQQARTDGTDGIVINPGGWTHTSVAIRDALLGVSVPFIELHVSNIHAREEWRHHSYFSDKAKAIIAGCGALGYEYAVDFVIKKFPERSEPSESGEVTGGNPTATQ